ncbi:MAG: SDR family NAD(P)-dependent oxidoreductase [Phycisphaerae bacterium]|nr:SDR family NAD(P)-dependent oxidoreductase [Phycisphaerae bacterium]
MMDLSQKVVLITGASSGIGEALAVALARHHCRLLLVARRGDVLNALADRLRPDADDVDVFVGDVVDADQCAAAVEKAVAKWGRIDVAILSAGLGIYRRVHEFEPAEAARMIQVNVNGVVNCVGALLPVMIRQQSGVIVGLSSLAAHFVSPVSAAYAASKAAVSTFLEGIGRGVGKYGIHVLTVEPGYIRTPMTRNNKKLPFIIEADDCAARIIRGIRRKRTLLRFPWQMMLLIRLTRIVPRILMRWVVQRKAGRIVMR